jgi:hypothetical protein
LRQLEKKKKVDMKISWGTGIVIALIIFMGLVITMGIYLMNQDVQLVSDDYYDKEIAYQQHIDDVARTTELSSDEIILFDGSLITVKLPAELLAKNISGEIYFYRPSDSKLDIKFPFTPDENNQQIIPLERIQKGFWRVQFSWQADDKNYYSEKAIVIN